MQSRRVLVAVIVGCIAAVTFVPMALAATSDHGGIPAIEKGLGRRAGGRGRPLPPAPGDKRGVPFPAVWRNGACHDVTVPIVRSIDPDDGAEVISTDVDAAVDAQAGVADPARERNPTAAEAAACQARTPAQP